MTAQIKVKVQRKARVRLKVLPRFPSSVTGDNGIIVTKAGGDYTIAIDAAQFPNFSGAMPFQVGDLLVASSTTTLLGLAAGPLGYPLVSSGPATRPSYQPTPVFTPEMFVPTAGSGGDDTAAFTALATAARSAGGGIINLGVNKSYSVMPTPAVGQSTLLNLHNCEGLRINFNGSKLVCPATFTGGRTVIVISLQDCYDVEINGYYAEQTTTFTADLSNGLMGIIIDETNRDIRINAMYQKYGRSCVEVRRSTELAVDSRTRGIYINGLISDGVYYGVAPQKNGDQITIRGLRGINNARTIIAYNIRQLDFEVELEPGSNTGQDIVISTNTNHVESAISNTLSDVRGRVVSRTQSAAPAGFVAYGVSQGTATTCAGFFRNVDIRIDIEITTAANTAIAFEMFKQTFGGAADTTGRGHVVENVTISGSFKGFANNIDVIRWGIIGTWTGDTVRNLFFKNLASTGSGTGEFKFTSTGITSAYFESIKFAHNFAWPGDTGGIDFAADVLFANNNSFQQLAGKGASGSGRVAAAGNSSADNRLTRTDGVNSKVIQDSSITVDDLGNAGGFRNIAFNGSSSGTITAQPQAAAGTYNWNWPITAGSSGQPLLSGGGGATEMSFGTLGAAVGGTGQTTYAVGDILYASAATTLSKLADVATGNALISGGVTVAPAWGKIGLTTHVSGTLPVANGGTNYTGGAWTTSTPTPLSQGGTFTSASCSMAILTIGRLAFNCSITTITTVGTATGYLQVPVPVAPTRNTPLNAYRTSDNTPGGGYASASGSFFVFKYDGTTLLVSGAVIAVAVFYETT